ncbi:MAG: DUF1206 domain-containing protein [Kineosporiaceae bacterium]
MSATGGAAAAGRRAANSRALEIAARAGFIARGGIYVLVGIIAVQIALGHGGQADRGGALTQIATKSYGTALLWALVLGFAGLTLWRLSETVFGANAPGGQQTGERLKSLASAVLYAFFGVSTFQLVTGASTNATANGNNQPKAVTARVMTYSGGRLLIGLAGIVILAVGVMLARSSWTKEFLQRMNLAGAPTGTRTLVEMLGVIGGVARGAVIALAGVFVLVAAVRFTPSRAEGMDGTLRAFASTPLGPFLLIAVALGLIAFGAFSWCEARWRRV